MSTAKHNDHTDQTLSSVYNGGSRRRQIVIVAVVAVFALLVVFAAILWLRPAKEVKTEAPAAAATSGKVAFLMEQQWLIRMKLAVAEEQTVARQITATGRVIPAANSQAVVAPPVGGIVSSRNLPRMGQHVAQGQTIAVIQQVATSAEQAQVRAAAASLILAQYDAAVKRLEALGNSPSAEGSRATVGSANASYMVRAPLSGYVTKVNKSIGEQVAPGEAIVEISNLNTVWVEAPIFEKDLSRLAGNISATFTTPAYPDQEFKGTVVDIGAVIDEQTRAAKVIFQLPNDGRALRLGMQANVRLDAGEQVTAMMIPKEAVLEHEGKKIVYVLLSGEEFERREVTIGDELVGKVAVLAGLNKGERVVTQGAYQLKLQELQPAEAGAHTHET
jgi:RND family efflux transporter MFP subunit